MPVASQKLSFEQFGVEDGLSQSQVLCIAQDAQRHIWIGTQGGVNRFDGLRFDKFSRKDGLNASIIYSLYASKRKMLWLGTNKGLYNYDGNTFIHYPAKNDSVKGIYAIAETSEGRICVVTNRMQLVFLENGRLQTMPFPVDDYRITWMGLTSSGLLSVYCYNYGFYTFRNKKWEKDPFQPELDRGDFVRFCITHNNDQFLITRYKKIFRLSGNKVRAKGAVAGNHVLSATIEKQGGLWIASDKGVYIYNSQTLLAETRCNTANGFSDNLVHALFTDADGTVWLGSDGDGLFKYNGSSFRRYDASNGLQGNIVMGLLTTTDNRMFIATREGGLTLYDENTKTFKAIPYSGLSKSGINCIGGAPSGPVYIGTLDGKLLKYRKGMVSEVNLGAGRNSVQTITAGNNNIWISTFSGCFVIHDNKIKKIPGVDQLVFSVLPTGERSILIGTIEGIYEYTGNKTARKIDIPQLKDNEITCFALYRQYTVIGTSNNGIFFWNRSKNTIEHCDTEKGLAGNQVFSLFTDSKKNVWAGTGTGLQQVVFNEAQKSFAVRRFSAADGYGSFESNLNAITEDKQGRVWIGNTKGAFIYQPPVEEKEPLAPFTLIEGVVFPGNESNHFLPGTHLPAYPAIKYRGNHISFNFKGVYLKNPSAVKYSYMLEGYDTAFSKPTKETQLSYHNLEPGKYTFRVRAIAGMQFSSNTAEYSFTIQTPFHKTTGFIVLLVVALLLTGSLIQYSFAKAKRRRIRQIREIKEQEQQKVREQTAADFHDELGNKLTRISLLAEVLQQKTDPGDEEKRQIIDQIQSNARGLYTGTKEIIWSLSKESDTLKDVLSIIQQTGVELFSNINIQFEVSGLNIIDPGIKIPAGYNRDIIMIFKELMNNSMRHSNATQVTIEYRKEDRDMVGIHFTDNGIGFDENIVEKGNGLKNIKRRAERIGGSFTISANEGPGITCSLIFSI
ncbi:hypothetical protein GCM10027516_31890 [Niabella aquatica]